MKTEPIDRPPIEDPLAELERQLMRAYLAGAGHDLHALLMRDDEAARTALAEASRYAASKLSEIESRLRYLQKLHERPVAG
jgi:hypothetical protein